MTNTNYKGNVLRKQSVSPRRLNPLERAMVGFVATANGAGPFITDSEWVEEPGCPDALRVETSRDVIFTARFDVQADRMFVWMDGVERTWADTGLRMADLETLEARLIERFAEAQS